DRGTTCAATEVPTFPLRRGETNTLQFDATCAAHSGYHVMTMSNDDIYTPKRARTDRPSQGRAPGRGPVIDQEGCEIPDASMNTRSFRFDFGHSSANPFGNLTREQRLARL